MTVSALQVRALVRAAEGVRILFAQGEAHSSLLQSMSEPEASGLWTQRGDIAVATPSVMTLADRLPSPTETVPALFSLMPEVREAWLRVMRARLAEVGERADVAGLADAVTSAGSAAAELVAVTAPSLAPTPYAELERATLPAPAHEAAAAPVLLRVLAATAALRGGAQVPAVLPEIVAENPSTGWCQGRLLRLPAVSDTVACTAVLSGALDGRGEDGDAMRWALSHPWAFLLAQMVFTKEAWEAERVSGGIAFELEPAHVSLFQTPPRVEVAVTLPSGEEIRCGSLGELVQRTLAQLGVTVLAHRVTASLLDDRLASVIEAVQQRDIWRFEHGAGARRPAYVIHPSFSDACYRALGSRAFYRLGAPVTGAIRRTAEAWARERIARAGARQGEGPSA